jgi:membrane associated rhomboid family serine protease
VIPVQDVVPSGRPPLATLALVAFNVLAFATPTLTEQLPLVIGTLFGDTTLVNFVVGTWFLWLFGDNVEARVGRLTALVIYVACGWLALHLSSATSPPLPGMGAAGGITGILGAYFLLLPHSRVLTLLPVPPSLVEVPATLFLGGWWVLQLLTFVVVPAASGPINGAAVWGLGAAMLLGATVCRVMRRPVIWQ